jgi:predicted MFS family arabinose efflux permease
MPTPPVIPKNAQLRAAVVGLLALAVAIGFGRFAFTPLLPMMQDDKLLTIGEGGVLASVHFTGYWLGALFAARLPFAPMKALVCSLFAIAAGTLAMGLTESFALWVAFRFLCGACSAFVLVVVSSHTIRCLAEDGHVRKQGWVFSGVGAGIALAGLGTVVFMAIGTGSALVWQIFGLIALAASAVVFILTKKELPGAAPVPDKQAGPRHPLAWRTAIAYGAAGIGYIVPATYLPVMARETIQSPLVFGWSWPLFGAAAFLSTLISVRLHAHFSNRQIWAASQITMAAGLLPPVIYPHIGTVALAGICVGGTFVIIALAGMKEAHRTVSPYEVQRHIAALTTIFATGQIIGPVVAGQIFEATGSFSSPLLVTSIALASTALALTQADFHKEPVVR